MSSFENIKSKEDFEHTFKILKLLGKGASGSVVLTVDRKTQKKYAVKLSNFKNSKEKLRTTWLQKEYKIVKGLETIPNVVKYYGWFYWVDIENDANRILKTGIVMEALKGPDLIKVLKCMVKVGYSFSKKEAYLFMKKLSEILNEIHKKGVYHGDIKLANIVFSDKGIKFIDFGHSEFKRGTNLSQRVKVYGTLYNNSPEMTRAKMTKTKTMTFKQAFASDVWALAATIIRVITLNKNITPNPERFSLDNIRPEDVKFLKEAKIYDILKGMLNIDYIERYKMGKVVESLKEIEKFYIRDKNPFLEELVY